MIIFNCFINICLFDGTNGLLEQIIAGIIATIVVKLLFYAIEKHK